MVEPILNILSLVDREAFDPERMPGFLLILYITVCGKERTMSNTGMEWKVKLKSYKLTIGTK